MLSRRRRSKLSRSDAEGCRDGDAVGCLGRVLDPKWLLIEMAEIAVAVFTRQSALGTRHPAIGTRNSAPDTRPLPHSNWQSALGTRQSALRTRHSSSGTRHPFPIPIPHSRRPFNPHPPSSFPAHPRSPFPHSSIHRPRPRPPALHVPIPITQLYPISSIHSTFPVPFPPLHPRLVCSLRLLLSGCGPLPSPLPHERKTHGVTRLYFGVYPGVQIDNRG